MLTKGSHEYDLQKKENKKLFSKHLSRENPQEKSFRVLYYAKSCGAVPFMWESQPGTPKKDSMNPSTLCHFPTPLTPPPSYLSIHTPKTPKTPKTYSKSKSSQKKPSRGGDSFVISNILPRKIVSLKTVVSPSFSPSSKSSSSSTDLISLPSSMSLIEHFELEDDIYKSPTSTLCFGFNKQGFLEDISNRRAWVNFKFSL